MDPKVFKPKKKVDEKGYDEDGVMHEDCGTSDCCGKCETSETQDKE